MLQSGRAVILFFCVSALLSPDCTGQSIAGRSPAPGNTYQASNDYILGPNDQFSVWALGAEEMSDKIARVDPQGFVDLPLAGRLHVGGRTVEAVRSDLNSRLRPFLKDPQVAINITQYQ